MAERWLSVKGFEEFYEVSSLGRLRGLDCWRVSIRNNKKVWRRFKSKVIKTNGIYGGVINLRGKNGHHREVELHRLIGEHFISNPNRFPFVCHLDDNRKNNKASNLIWGNHQINMQHAKQNGLITGYWLNKRLSLKHRHAISKGLRR